MNSQNTNVLTSNIGYLIKKNTECALRLLTNKDNKGEISLDSKYQSFFKENPNLVTDKQRSVLKEYWLRENLNNFWNEMVQDIEKQGKPSHEQLPIQELLKKLHRDYKKNIFELMYRDDEELRAKEEVIANETVVIDSDAQALTELTKRFTKDQEDNNENTIERYTGQFRVETKESIKLRQTKTSFYTYISKMQEANFASFSLIGGKNLDYLTLEDIGAINSKLTIRKITKAQADDCGNNMTEEQRKNMNKNLARLKMGLQISNAMVKLRDDVSNIMETCYGRMFKMAQVHGKNMMQNKMKANGQLLKSNKKTSILDARLKPSEPIDPEHDTAKVKLKRLSTKLIAEFNLRYAMNIGLFERFEE